MANRNWKRIYANSLRQAMEFCVEYARVKKNLSVEKIANLMGESSHYTLYKWLDNGRMPAIKIRAFEHVCGMDYVTEYLAHSANKLVLPIPTGRKSKCREINELGQFMTETVTLLYQHQEGTKNAEETIAALTQVMESLAYQRGNVEKEQQPALELI
jgi:hypothetical protein